MPFSVPPVLHSQQQSLLQQGTKDTPLVVLSYETEVDAENGFVIYRGGVKAKYGVTNLKADVLIVRKGNPSDPGVDISEGGQTILLRPNEAYALGKVDIVDPDGTVQASNFWFTWDADRRSHAKEVVGRAENVELSIGASHIVAKKISMTKEGFDLTDTSFWTSNWHVPLYRFDADSVHITPGKKGVAKHLRTTLFGVQLPVIPQYTFNLDPRSQGITIPTLGFRQGAGVGLSWESRFLLNDTSAVSGQFAAFPDVQPTYAVSYSRSKVADDSVDLNQFSISNQFAGRSPYSYFGNVTMDSLQTAYDRMRIPKDLFSVNSTFNYESYERATDRRINHSLPLEVGMEKGGPAGNWAYLVQAKAARIVEGGSLSAFRLTLDGSGFSPLAHSGKLSLGTRLDAQARIDASSSGYFGAETGFSYGAAKALTLSAGAYGYKSFGTPFFQSDIFTTNQGYVVRGDLSGSSTNVSIMFRYDPTQGWFDREYRISQVMGPIEPVLVYRQVPREYVIGIRFRTQDIAKILKKRSIKRDNEKTPQ